MIIDTHAHLFWDSFQEDYDQVIQRAVDAGVTGAINVGVDLKTSEIAQNLNSDQIRFFSTIGIHPHEAMNYFNDIDVSIHKNIARLEDLYKESISKVVAVGECGLDYYFPHFVPQNGTSRGEPYLASIDSSTNSKNHPDTIPSLDQLKQLQKQLLQAQIDLAKKLQLPLTIHCRDDRSQNPENSECWDDCLDLIRDHFGVLHCYSGLEKTTRKALELNFMFSFAGNITYKKNEYLREAIKIIPLEKIVVETDCPFLPPQTYRGKRNEPSYIIETLQTIADIKRLSIEKTKEQIYQNNVQMFKLK